MKWMVRGRELALNRVYVMGIVNMTPDSFSDGGLFDSQEKAILQAQKLIREGADILDIGAESTKPGALEVDANLQIKRLGNLIRNLSQLSDTPLSIDTTQAEVAEYALEQGAHIINDVSALGASGRRMADVVKRFRAGLILMHRRGNALTMQSLTQYGDVVKEVKRELSGKIQEALSYGIAKEQIVIDPGIGFAKTSGQSFEVLSRLSEFRDLGFPLLVGASRKSFLSSAAGMDMEKRDDISVVAHLWAIYQGAQIIRVHQVQKHQDAVETFEIIKRSKEHVGTF